MFKDHVIHAKQLYINIQKVCMFFLYCWYKLYRNIREYISENLYIDCFHNILKRYIDITLFLIWVVFRQNTYLITLLTNTICAFMWLHISCSRSYVTQGLIMFTIIWMFFSTYLHALRSLSYKRSLRYDTLTLFRAHN